MALILLLSQEERAFFMKNLRGSCNNDSKRHTLTIIIVKPPYWRFTTNAVSFLIHL